MKGAWAGGDLPRGVARAYASADARSLRISLAAKTRVMCN